MVKGNKVEDLLGLHDSDIESGTDDGLDELQDTRFTKKQLRSMTDSDNNDDDDDEDEDEDDQASDDEDDQASDDDMDGSDLESHHEDEEEQHEEQEGNDNPLAEVDATKGKRKKTKLKPMTVAELEELELANKRSGVCYLSRIPPFMTPKRVRLLLSKYADLGKLYLAPEGKWKKMKNLVSMIYLHALTLFSCFVNRFKNHSKTPKIFKKQTSQLY